MSYAELIFAKVRALPPMRQQEVLDFVEFLQQKESDASRDLKGLWTDLGADLTAEELEAARREAWTHFPREDVGQ